MKPDWTTMIAILRSDVVPALGCTEPISVALAAAHCRAQLGDGEADRITVRVSGNLFKNGMGVVVPGTGTRGLAIAAAAGWIAGDAEAGLEVLKGLTPADADVAKTLLGQVSVDVADVPDALYAEVEVVSRGETARTVICSDHTRVVLVEKNGVLIAGDASAATGAANAAKPNLSLASIVEFAEQVEFDQIAFIYNAATMNSALADEGMRGYGLAIGKMLAEQVEKKLLSDDLLTLAMRLSSAASDARMDGAMLPAMSNSGSGNQGIAATMPVVAAARFLNASESQLTRALAMSHLIAIYIKSMQSKLSALCAASTAAMGAGAAVTWLLGGDIKQIGQCVNNMIGDIAGIICDGAGSACSMKVSTSVSAAIKAALMAIGGYTIPACEGIVCDNADQTIANLGRLAREGMGATDVEIIRIMRSKSH